MQKFRPVMFIVLSVAFFSCNKNTETVPGTRLVKVVTNTLDGFQKECAGCFYYQFFSYDQNGRLISMRDSSSSPAGFPQLSFGSSPHVYALYYSHKYYRLIEYDSKGNVSRATRDSFIYNSNNQIVQRFRRVQCETCPSYLLNKYVYDTKNRLIADSEFTGQTFLVPVSLLNEYTTIRYDNNDNVTHTERIGAYPPGNAPYIMYAGDYTYDNNPSPFKSMGFVAYMNFHDPFILSNNNVSRPGYTYEYYSNGLIKKITYKGHAQEFFYE